MKSILLIVTLVLATQSGPQVQPSSLKDRRAADAAIHALLAAQVESWNRGDLEGFMNGYWHSLELTFFSTGTVFKGWQAALERYQRNYQGSGKEMGKLEFQELSVDLLDSEAALVRGRWELTMSNGKKPHGLFTLILRKMDQGWRIVHDHTSSAEAQ